MKALDVWKRNWMMVLGVVLFLAFCIPGTVPAGSDPPPPGANLTSMTDGCTNQIDGIPLECKECDEAPANSPGNGAGTGPGNGNKTAISGPLSVSQDTGKSAGNPVDVGHNSKFEYFTDVSMPLSSGLEFGIQRVYTSGRLANTLSDYGEGVYPMSGKSWHFNIDARIFSQSGTQVLLVQLPCSRVRTFVWYANQEKWLSLPQQGFLGELTFDSETNIYTLLYPNGHKLLFNQRGRLTGWVTPQGKELTFERSVQTIGSVEYDRVTAIHAPSADGRRLELSYHPTQPHLMTQAALKNSSYPSFTQVMMTYEYSTDSASQHLMEKALRMDTTTGQVYRYGSWDSAQQQVIPLQTTGNRTLATVATISPIAGERKLRAYSYRPGGFGYDNYLNGWAPYEPWTQWKASYSAQNPGVPSNMSMNFAICQVGGTGGTDQGSVGLSYNMRVHRGDWNSAYTDYNSNGDRDPFQALPSGSYVSASHHMLYNSNRLPTVIYAPGQISTLGSIYGSGELFHEIQYSTSAGEYLAQNNPVFRTDLQGRSSAYQYDAIFNKPTLITDPFDRKIKQTLNASGQTVGHFFFGPGKDPDVDTPDWAEERQYNSHGQPSVFIDRHGKQTSYTYYGNGEGLPHTITYPDGRVQTFTYDPMGQVTQIESSDGPTVYYSYSGDRLLETTVNGETTQYQYDELGRRTGVRDPKGQWTYYEYDGAGRLIKVTDTANGVTRYEYDLWDNLTRFEDPKGNVTEYYYDEAGRYSTTSQRDAAKDRWLKDGVIYGGQSCSSCGNAGKIARSFHHVEYDPGQGQNTITWKEYSHDIYGRLTEVKYYNERVYDPQDPGDVYQTGTLARTLSYSYDHYANGKSSDLVTAIQDTGLPFTGKWYLFNYDNDLQLRKVTHPEGCDEEYFYDATVKSRLVARRDVDGGVTTYAHDNDQRLQSVTDAWGYVTQYAYVGTGDVGPRGAVKEILYGNGTKAQYTYDSAGRLARLRNRAAGGADMSHHAYTYDANGNITRVDLGAEGTARDAWAYVYDALNRLTRETRLAVASGGQETTRWYRDYAYDPAGNRTAMTWFDGSAGYSSSYAYNALNQLLWSNQYNPNELFIYAFDSRGNMTEKWEDLATNDWQYVWNTDNRLTKVTMTHQTTQTQKTDVEYAYDHQGARVLKRRLLADGAADGARTRYFFHGLTEEVVKRSVAGAHADTAFEFVTRLDGTLAPSHWQNASAVSSVADAQRHPGGVASGTVIRVAPEQWAVHGAGAGGWSYGVTGRRVMSAWVKSGADGKFAVLVSTSVGDRELRYYFGGPSSGAPAYVSSTEAHFRSTLALDGCWHRLERNLAADVAAAWSGATLTGVRGMAFHAYHASSAMWVDDVRFSNAMTLERNSLLPGAVGQIACRRATDATNFGHSDAFYFYDHIGNVQGVSSSGGAVAESYVQDAWGNVLASATTGQWATSFAGRHLTTKEQDADVGMYFFWQRWYLSHSGRFPSIDPIPGLYFIPSSMNTYHYCGWNPNNHVDPTGEYAIIGKALQKALEGCMGGMIAGVTSWPSTRWPSDGYRGAAELTCDCAFGAIGGLAGGIFGGYITRNVASGFMKGYKCYCVDIAEDMWITHSSNYAPREDSKYPTVRPPDFPGDIPIFLE